MLTCHRVLVISLGSLYLLFYFVSIETLLPFYTMKQGDQQKVDKKVFLIYLATPYYRDPWGRENVTCAGKKVNMPFCCTRNQLLDLFAYGEQE